MSPLAGTSIANLEKSQRHANHQFKSATMRFEVEGETVLLTQGGVNMSGKQESSTLTLRADGQEHPVSPEAPGVVVVTNWIGPNVLETVGKKDDKVLGRGTYEVSADRRTLTATVGGVDGAGKACRPQVIVLDRA